MRYASERPDIPPLPQNPLRFLRESTSLFRQELAASGVAKKASTTLSGAEATFILCFALLLGRREGIGERLSVRRAHAGYVIPALSRLQAGIRAE